MQEQTGRPPHVTENYRGWQSDVIVDLIKRYGFPFITLNPGASFRGLHDLVGLLHACMAIYYAYIDRVPIFIIGATGPMDEAKRRPHIDWTHSALVQGNAVRDYVKWDYQPTSIEGVPES